MLTEEQAADKWCPMVRHPVYGMDDRPSGGNSHQIGGAVCIGSACMMWRWDMTWASSSEEGIRGDVVVRLKRRDGDPKLGYCGLAWRPE